jgi:hypothetical protein
MIPNEAVRAGFIEIYERGHIEGVSASDIRRVLEAAAPHLMPTIEWGIFRATDDGTGEPSENRRYRTREAAEKHLRYDYSHPEFWEVRGRAVGKWSKNAV